jgi:cell division control protein 45
MILFLIIIHYVFRIPLRQCQQKFIDMDKNLKETLREQMDTVAPDYGLSDLCFPSFIRYYTFTLKYSASDVVYSMNALLSAPPEIATKLGTEILWTRDKEKLTIDMHTIWRQNFYTAYDALNMYVA